MIELAKRLSVGKRVRLAMLEASKEFNGNVTSNSSSAKQRAKNSHINLSHTWKSNNGFITMIGIGKGNSIWHLEISSEGKRSISKFKSIEDFIQNAVSRVSNDKYNSKLIQKVRFLCRAINENEFEFNTGSKKDYDVVRWRRAKKDMAECLLKSPELYQEFVSKAAIQILEGMGVKQTEDNMVKCLHAAQLAVKELCET